MALIAHQNQGSFAIASLRPEPSFKSLKLGSSISFKSSGRHGRHVALKYNILRCPYIIWRKEKSFNVKSFKGNARNGESDGKDSSSKFNKATFQISPLKQERDDIALADMADAKKLQLSYSIDDGQETISGSRSIKKLFNKWLVMLITQSSRSKTGTVLKEVLIGDNASVIQNLFFRINSWKILKAAANYFFSLDAAISLPLLIFIPWFTFAKFSYGSEITKELTPLWILGPITVALYVYIVRELRRLYTFCFSRTVFFFIKSVPEFSLSVYSFIIEGRVKLLLWSHLFKPIVDMKNIDYRGHFLLKLGKFREWILEKYLDYVESIWPFYCRTIRFLKKSNLI